MTDDRVWSAVLYAEFLGLRDRCRLGCSCNSLSIARSLNGDDKRAFWEPHCPRDLLAWRKQRIESILYGTFSIDRRARKRQVNKHMRALERAVEVPVMWKVWASGLTSDEALVILSDTYDDCDQEQVHELGRLLGSQGWSVRFLRECYPSSQHSYALQLKEGLVFLHGDYFRRGVLSAIVLRPPAQPSATCGRRRRAW
jgi:hypothetical protein